MPRYDRITQPEIQSTVERIHNSLNTAEGSVLPPKQSGPSRVPIISNLKILSQKTSFGINLITLTWDIPQATNLDGYQIYYSINNQTYVSPLRVQSPAVTLPIFSDNSPNQRASIAVQTILKNGFVSDLTLSPTVSVILGTS